ncbi:MerR family transcriptional regulator [Gottfriedia sp. NPDC056225]|uniref:MerR family transcriptional regulator n=1 Tax=Gottfriedia sp. NPDC056225 TaxID=3345751 RepID=UPI0035D84025
MGKFYHIKEAAKKLNMSIDTLRYYEKIGLVGEIDRDQNGYRIYKQTDLDWFTLIGYLRSIGVPIQDMLQFQNSHGSKTSSVEARKAFMENYRKEIITKKIELEDIIKKLDKKIDFLNNLTYEDIPH